jgi:hypothetical protein
MNTSVIVGWICHLDLDACSVPAPPAEMKLWHFIDVIFISGPGQDFVSYTATTVSKYLIEGMGCCSP